MQGLETANFKVVFGKRMQPNPAPQKANARAWGTGGTNKGYKTVYAEGWVIAAGIEKFISLVDASLHLL